MTMGLISEVDGGPTPVEVKTVMHQFETIVQKHPERLAVVSCHQASDLYGFGDGQKRAWENLRWTYGTLHQAVHLFVSYLRSYCLGPGTPILLFSHNRVECLIVTLGAYCLGYTHVPITPDSLSNLSDVQYMLDTACTTHVHQRIVVISDAEVAKSIDQLVIPHGSVKIAMDGSISGWVAFESLMEPIKNDANVSSIPAQSILFTSGTTFRPKACLVPADRWFSALPQAMSLGRLEPCDVMAFVLPNHHAFGHICMIMPLLCGSSLVIAAPKFELESTVRAMDQEHCTHLGLVGTMAYGLLESFCGTEAKSLNTIIFGGMVLSPGLIQTCFNKLGLVTIENLYGMTEGVFSTTGPVSDLNSITKYHNLSIGCPVPGLKMRICKLNDRICVPRGTIGELHATGHTMVQGYLSGEAESFYHEGGQIWFRTGDSAIVAQDGQVYILGRYKDTINRGGENIAPAKIEAVLAQMPIFSAMSPVVIRKEDHIAGEVPIVLTKEPISSEQIKLLQETVRSTLGIFSVPTGALSLRALNINDYPRTSSGKINKNRLIDLVALYDKTSSDEARPAYIKWEISVTKAWGQILSLAPLQLELTAPLTHLADSILMLTARDRIRKDTGKTVALSAWMKTATLAEQITLLQSQACSVPSGNKHEPSSEKQRLSNVQGMTHLRGNPDSFELVKVAVQKTIMPFCLSWEDVDEVYPCSDFIRIISKYKTVDEWNIRTTLVSKFVDTRGMRNAIERALFINPILLSFIVMDNDLLGPDLAIHVSIQQTREVLDRCIETYQTVDTLDDVRSVAMKYPFPDHTNLPGPLFRALLLFVRQTSSVAAIINISHSVIDKTSHQLFLDDLSRAVDGETLSPHVNYKQWTHEYHQLRKSASAQSAIEFHSRYLCDLKKHGHVLWPYPTYQLTVTPERSHLAGHLMTFPAHALLHLCQVHSSLSPAVVIKAALALLVISRTNHSHALFGSFEAARTAFPFSSDAACDAMDVAGPVFNVLVNLVAFRPKESVLGFLEAMQQEQNQLTQHSTVPWQEVLPRIHCTDRIFTNVTDALLYNWMPGLNALAAGPIAHRNMEITQIQIRAKVGMLVNAGMSQHGTEVILQFEGSLANRSTMWIERAGEELKRICLWLTAESSWSLPLEDFVHCIS